MKNEAEMKEMCKMHLSHIHTHSHTPSLSLSLFQVISKVMKINVRNTFFSELASSDFSFIPHLKYNLVLKLFLQAAFENFNTSLLTSWIS